MDNVHAPCPRNGEMLQPHFSPLLARPAPNVNNGAARREWDERDQVGIAAIIANIDEEQINHVQGNDGRALTLWNTFEQLYQS